MKRWLLILMTMALSLLAVSPVLADEDMGCAHDDPTIELRHPSIKICIPCGAR